MPYRSAIRDEIERMNGRVAALTAILQHLAGGKLTTGQRLGLMQNVIRESTERKRSAEHGRGFCECIEELLQLPAGSATASARRLPPA